MVLFELLGMAVPSFLAGRLPSPAVAMSANTIYMAFRYLFTMVYLGISFVAGIRVGNALGRGDAVSAKNAAIYSIQLSAAWALVATVAMMGLGPYYAQGYTSDKAILSTANDLFWYTRPAQTAIGIWGTVQVIFRGMGHPHQGAILNFIDSFSCRWSLARFTLCTIYGLYWFCTVDWESMVHEVESTFQQTATADAYYHDSYSR
ncbi:hypothetical protein SPRG_07764 [Saprolegnia parasitica CBS 223.65]|uniref:MATE efflux family protein n=1 Tax=Saprolegnia parasitica (strain CBS 223.65) TaxID=695850 RepID=A0A067C963_SAPPC|nr:hypothetical protein SPRG_07764 [Saprolegnia parasitica CBS 223.65]KDO27053.1 hypothetical protein SPRG_07764 [Saprolegnia parasitica CBS 223.65]|eukprot:XP_012202148.1 hypothetical protein SPRG_07764 [Saprolegnia parasitica CBS 223.65]